MVERTRFQTISEIYWAETGYIWNVRVIFFNFVCSAVNIFFHCNNFYSSAGVYTNIVYVSWSQFNPVCPCAPHVVHWLTELYVRRWNQTAGLSVRIYFMLLLVLKNVFFFLVEVQVFVSKLCGIGGNRTYSIISRNFVELKNSIFESRPTIYNFLKVRSSCRKVSTADIIIEV